VSVLIVEDDAEVLLCIESLLEFSDVHVQSCENGREALEYLAGLKDHELPSLILLDLMMPIMDGYAFRQEQLDQERLRYIPTIILSGHDRGKLDAQMMRCSAYLRKPFTIDELMDAVRNTGTPLRYEIVTRCLRKP